MGSKMEEKWIKHYSSRHKILLVGEGDFSFALCLANAFGSASNIVATSLDSRGSLKWKYSRASTNLEELENLGCIIVDKVDAHSMHEHPFLQNKFFDRIVYNFPHAGFGRNFPECYPHLIELHKNLVLGFLNNARKMLIDVGEVHVTHKNGYPYCKWDLVKLAKEAGLVLVERVRFEIWEYPGYNNKFGSGKNCDGNFTLGDCSTYKFSINRRKKETKVHDVGLCVSGLSASTISVSSCATLEPDKPVIESVEITAVEPDKPKIETVEITVVDKPEVETVEIIAVEPNKPEIETVGIIVVEQDKPEIETFGISVVEPDEPVIETVVVTGVKDKSWSGCIKMIFKKGFQFVSRQIFRFRSSPAANLSRPLLQRSSVVPIICLCFIALGLKKQKSWFSQQALPVSLSHIGDSKALVESDFLIMQDRGLFA